MSEKSKLLNSREAWKNKAICRVKSLAYSTNSLAKSHGTGEVLDANRMALRLAV